MAIQPGTFESQGIETWIARYMKSHAPRARSLIVTLFGDTVMPYREQIWTGDLIALLAAFGINQRLVRTSVYRLSEAGWLTAERRGRRSCYRLAPAGRRRFRHAYDRVYRHPQAWNGGWVIAMAPKNVASTDRARLQRELEWEGYAAAATGVFLRPTDDETTAREAIEGLGLAGQVTLFQARAAAGAGQPAIAALTSQSWALTPAAEAYAGFNAHFAPLLPWAQNPTSLRPEAAFVTQTLMIDAFRWATLKDPQLPASLLPDQWPGHAARVLCRELYCHLYRHTRRHFTTITDTNNGILPIPTSVSGRFGGLV